MTEGAYRTATAADATAALADFVARHPRLLVLGGAGCSTRSGIPDYRDEAGAWKRRPPVTWQAFTGDAATCRRYWARSLVGWPHVAAARPGLAHRALAALEGADRIDALVTQNVDGLHQAAGSFGVIDLHGRIDQVICLDCGDRSRRAALQARLLAANPEWVGVSALTAPDGDADLERDFDAFVVPPCAICGGRLKPDVVFFGENVPPPRVAAAMQALARADALLVAGSSLMVYSGYRFVLAAVAAGQPVAAVNLGTTRADALLTLKVVADVGDSLAAVCARLGLGSLP